MIMTDSVENLLMALRHLNLCQVYIYNGLQLCFFSVKEKNCVCVSFGVFEQRSQLRLYIEC